MEKIHLDLARAVLEARQELAKVAGTLSGRYTNPRGDLISMENTQTNALIKKVARYVDVAKQTIVSQGILEWLAELPEDSHFQGSFSAALEGQLHVLASAAAVVIEAIDRQDRWLAQPSVFAHLASSASKEAASPP